MIQKNLKNWKEKSRLPPEELGPTVTNAEFEKALNELKSKKAYGVDIIPAQLLPALDEKTKLTLCCLIYNIYTTGKIPDDFKKSIMVMLPKKSKSTKCEEYRTLSILTHTPTILTKITLGRIEKKIDGNLAEDQFGF